jgi:DNA-binding IclR family transcriptional regulator
MRVSIGFGGNLQKTSTPVQYRRPKLNSAQAGSGGADRYLSKAIGRALDVLDLFEDERVSVNLRELSSRMRLPESSLFRILLTLVDRGYLQQDGSGCYSLAPKLLYGKIYDRAMRLKNFAHPVLRRLADQFNETVSMAYLFESRVQVLDTIEALHEVRMINTPGRVLPPHCSSMGKAIAAFQEPAFADQMLSVYGLIRRTPLTKVDRQAIMSDYETIRQRGFAVDREEAAEGGICIGAPIRPEDGAAIAALSVSTPVSRMSPEKERVIIEAVTTAAAEITALLVG